MSISPWQKQNVSVYLLSVWLIPTPILPRLTSLSLRTTTLPNPSPSSLATLQQRSLKAWQKEPLKKPTRLKKKNQITNCASSSWKAAMSVVNADAGLGLVVLVVVLAAPVAVLAAPVVTVAAAVAAIVLVAVAAEAAAAIVPVAVVAVLVATVLAAAVGSVPPVQADLVRPDN